MPNAKVLEEKQAIVARMTEEIKNAAAGVFVDYKGITVADDTKLRKELREAGVKYNVVKNTLTLRACKDAGLEGVEELLNGTTALATSAEDPVAAAKILSKFAETAPNFSIKAGFVDGKMLSVSEVDALAKLPSKEVLIAKVLGGIQAPISGLVNVLNGNIRGLVVALNAIAEQKGA